MLAPIPSSHHRPVRATARNRRQPPPGPAREGMSLLFVGTSGGGGSAPHFGRSCRRGVWSRCRLFHTFYGAAKIASSGVWRCRFRYSNRSNSAVAIRSLWEPTSAPPRESGRARRGAGDVDILVNNAGFSWFGPSVDLGAGRFDALFDSNVRAPYLLVSAFAPAMLARLCSQNSSRPSVFPAQANGPAPAIHRTARRNEKR